jgi:hypothetical protein
VCVCVCVCVCPFATFQGQTPRRSDMDSLICIHAMLFARWPRRSDVRLATRATGPVLHESCLSVSPNERARCSRRKYEKLFKQVSQESEHTSSHRSSCCDIRVGARASGSALRGPLDIAHRLPSYSGSSELKPATQTRSSLSLLLAPTIACNYEYLAVCESV